MNKRFIYKYPLFIFFLTIYPIVSLFANNVRETEPETFWRPFVLSIAFATALTLLIQVLAKDWMRTYLISSFIIVVFFSYGQISMVIENAPFFETSNVSKSFFFILQFIFTCILILMVIQKIMRSRIDQNQVFSTLNIISLALLLFPAYQIVAFNISQVKYTKEQNFQSATTPTSTNQQPDIYYIILDAYARNDVMTLLGYDNSEFIEELENMGYYVAGCSRSNYPQTILSMASSLNMGYLWDVVSNQGPDDRNSNPVFESIPNNRVRQILENKQYKIITFYTGSPWLGWEQTDVYYKPELGGFFQQPINTFEYIFLETTAFYPFLEQDYFLWKKYEIKYYRIKFILEQLEKVPDIPGPKFIYAHMIIPHPPNIFLPDGSPNFDADYYRKGVGAGINREYDIKGYINNARYISAQLPNILRNIIENSENPPIIIVQGDHGYDYPDIRFDILNAYYLPNNVGRDLLYPTISPVNTFRLILSTYFGENYELLPDKSINIGINRPYGKKLAKPIKEVCPLQSVTSLQK